MNNQQSGLLSFSVQGAAGTKSEKATHSLWFPSNEKAAQDPFGPQKMRLVIKEYGSTSRYHFFILVHCRFSALLPVQAICKSAFTNKRRRAGGRSGRKPSVSASSPLPG